MNTLDTYCPTCDSEVVANVILRPTHVKVKGDDVDIVERVAVCPSCGCEIGDSRIESENLSLAYNAYAASHDLVSADQAKEIRSRFGLSVREFSRFLGFGEQTYARYEAGSLPSLANSNTIRLATTTAGARSLLNLNGGLISNASRSKVERVIGEMERGETGSSRFISLLDFGQQESCPPSIDNGYRTFSFDRAAALVHTLASKCPDLYKTKLQKAMFFCDFLSCEKTGTSITGLRYAHADYGPMMRDGDFLIAELRSCGIVDMQEHGWGEVVVPLGEIEIPFTADELATIDEVAKCVNTFDTAKALSSYSHTLSCWIDTKNGEIIGYNHKYGEIGGAVANRIAQLK